MPKTEKTPPTRVMNFLHGLREQPSRLGDEVSDQLTLATALKLDPAYLSRVLSGKTPVGPAVIGRATVFLPAAEACRLIEAYLADELDQIATHRIRLGKKYRRPSKGQFQASVNVTKLD